MLGKAEDSLQVFAKVEKWTRKHYTFDLFAKRKSKEYLEKKKLTEIDKKLIIAYLEVKGHRFYDAEKTLKQLEEMLTPAGEKKFTKNFVNDKCNHLVTADNVAYYNFVLGRNQRYLCQEEKAKEAFTHVFELEPLIKEEIFVVPHSLVEYAELLLEDGEWKEAKKMLHKAKNNYSKYDFDKPLTRR